MTTPAPDAAVRTAVVADADAMARVQAAAWHQDLAPLLPSEAAQHFTEAGFAPVWQASLQQPPSPRHRAMVATQGEQTVGLAAFAPVSPSDDAPGREIRAELLVLCVAPSARRQGHGSRLLNASVDTLRANDFEELEAWLPSADDTTRAFLEAAGLHADGAWREREVDENGATLREIRLSALIVDR